MGVKRDNRPLLLANEIGFWVEKGRTYNSVLEVGSRDVHLRTARGLGCTVAEFREKYGYAGEVGNKFFRFFETRGEGLRANMSKIGKNDRIASQIPCKKLQTSQHQRPR